MFCSIKKGKRTKKPVAQAPSLGRGLCILEDLHAQARDQSGSAIAERLGLLINSTLRLLFTLESNGYIKRDSGSLKYRMTRKPASLVLNGGRERAMFGQLAVASAKVISRSLGHIALEDAG